MKKIIVLLFVFNIVLNLMAQKKVDLDSLNLDQLNLYKEQAIKMRKTGIILTFAGLAGYTTGILLMKNYMEKTPPPGLECRRIGLWNFWFMWCCFNNSGYSPMDNRR